MTHIINVTASKIRRSISDEKLSLWDPKSKPSVYSNIYFVHSLFFHGFGFPNPIPVCLDSVSMLLPSHLPLLPPRLLLFYVWVLSGLPHSSCKLPIDFDFSDPWKSTSSPWPLFSPCPHLIGSFQAGPWTGQRLFSWNLALQSCLFSFHLLAECWTSPFHSHCSHSCSQSPNSHPSILCLRVWGWTECFPLLPPWLPVS